MTMKNKMYVECLKQALSALEDGCSFVCWAIDNTSFTYPVRKELKVEIIRRIAPYTVVTDWLVYEKDIPFRQVHEHRQEYRIAWVKSLIEEFSK